MVVYGKGSVSTERFPKRREASGGCARPAKGVRAKCGKPPLRPCGSRGWLWNMPDGQPRVTAPLSSLRYTLCANVC